MSEIYNKSKDTKPDNTTSSNTQKIKKEESLKPKEVGGPKGKEPTRYGDWEKNGRCSDF
ncbi:MAG: DUF1674 domain-containing protein [Rickettsiales bacterium]|jgi:hypothetical protein|nr:DUF1674 domain-containing protein [Rickettsiales bacterium]